jgi:hypothetical protein
MARNTTPALSRFECTYHPCSRAGAPIPNESGELPCVIVDAVDAKAAAVLAHKQIGFPIVETTRVAEDIAPPKKPRAKRQPKARAADLAALGLTTAAALLAARQTTEEIPS